LGVRKLVRRLPPWVEFATVVCLAFGWPIFNSLWALVAVPSAPHISAGHLRFVVAYELIVSAILLSLLGARGRTATTVGLAPTLEDIFLGGTLVAAVWLASAVTTLFVATMWPQAFRIVSAVDLGVGSLDLPTVVAVSVVNGTFEELFVCGYVMTALGRRHSVWTAINVSVAIRFSYHLYQGPLAVVDIIPMGLICSYFYARTGRLWPPIVAHAVLDFLAFAAYTGG